MNGIVTKLENGNYVATEQQVETLAHERYLNASTVTRADGTYLKILIVAAQAKLGRPRGRGVKPNAADQASVLEGVHVAFYAAVLRGVVTPDIAVEDGLEVEESRRRSLERNRRSAFARSAKSTLAAYVEGGGDLRTLIVETTSKAALRAAIAPPEPANKVARQIQRAQGALVRACVRQARGSPDDARDSLEAAIGALQAILDGIEEPEEVQASTPARRAAPVERAAQRTRVGVPQFHRGA